MKRIAIIGGGGTGKSIAADLTLSGFEVVLYEQPEYKKTVDDVIEHNGIEVCGALGQHFAKINKITTDIQEALDGTEIIFVAVIATRHEKIAELCAPYIKDAHTIIIGPGNAGSLVFHNFFKYNGVKSEADICEIAGNYYSCRLIGPAKVLIALPKKPKRIASFPAKNTIKVINKLGLLKGIYDYIPATNVLEVALSSPNIANHLAASILNTGSIEQSGGDYYLYRQGITPSVLQCINSIDEERRAIFNALGYYISKDDMLEKVMRHNELPDLDNFRALIGPTNMRHRYIVEDSLVGQSLMISLGEMINVSTPASRAFITLASIINNTDYLREGRTVQKLGIDRYSISELNKYLVEGPL